MSHKHKFEPLLYATSSIKTQWDMEDFAEATHDKHLQWLCMWWAKRNKRIWIKCQEHLFAFVLSVATKEGDSTTIVAEPQIMSLAFSKYTFTTKLLVWLLDEFIADRERLISRETNQETINKFNETIILIQQKLSECKNDTLDRLAL